MPTSQDVLRVARTWLGVRFQHQGRRRDTGVDCIGLVIETCREVGLVHSAGLPNDWDHVAYGRFPESYTLTLHLLAYLTPVARAQVEVADVVLFQMDTGEPAHMGFVGDAAQPFSLLHAFNARTKRQAKVQEHRLGPWWLARLHSVYRLPLSLAG